MLKDKVDKAPFILLGSLGMSPELSLEGGFGQHLLREVGALWDTWHCRWAMMGVRGEFRLPCAWRSKFEDLCVQNHSCNGTYCPREGIKVNER